MKAPRDEIAGQIPTDDPRSALAFCRRLRAFLKEDEGTGPSPKLSVVVPVYNEDENLAVLIERLDRALRPSAAPYEIVLVNDGSDEPCGTLLDRLADENEHVVVVQLSRNFGHQIAVSAGLDYARGHLVAVMDADLQDPPEVLGKMMDKLGEGYDVVYGIRCNRKESWFKKRAYSLFYRLLNRMTAIDIPLDAGDFCVMTRRVAETLRALPERTRFVRGIRSWVGFKQVGFPYDREQRYAGQSKYRFWRLLFLALNGVVSLSKTPLRIVTVLGFVISAFSVLMGLGYTIKRLLVGLNPPGFATLITGICLLAGVQLITVGVVGEYVGRIFDEVKRRPLYIVKEVRRKR